MYVFADRCGEGGQKIAAASVDGFAAVGKKKKKKWAEGGEGEKINWGGGARFKGKARRNSSCVLLYLTFIVGFSWKVASARSNGYTEILSCVSDVVFAENYSKITKVKSLKMVFIHSASWKIQEYLNMQTVLVFNIWYFPHHIYVRWILDRIWLLSYLWCHKSCWKARLLKVQFVKKSRFLSLVTNSSHTYLLGKLNSCIV